MGRIREFDVDQAVDRAMDLFWRRGYAETALQDLLDELSIGSGSFYAAFGSKEQLYLRALERYSALQADDLVKILEHATEIRSAVRQVLVAMIEADLTDPSRGCLVVNTATECGGRPPAAERVVAAMRQVESSLAGALERARSRGELAPDKNPVELARFLTTFVQGLRVVGRARLGRSFVEDALAVAMRALG
ncbi:TetR/AcrR family transcriptional regulator [Streptomyces sp. PA03-1a]|nr:TetR/AcrR family transcriptional regulator [Streptomyces sp. PA03-1a]MDX2815318.1 TetR/AcrR family transcriptional regulator [Streptomyces sp. PA03-5A]